MLRHSFMAVFLAASSLSLSAEEVSEVSSIYSLSLQELLQVRVVTAVSGYEQSLDDAPATVTLIQREQWQAMGATELGDALIAVPGVHTGIETLSQASPTYNLRGTSGTFNRNVKVLIDGLAVEAFHFGGRGDTYLYPLISNLKRIEVVKGPGSVVYGADAFAGVINLVLPDAGDSSFNQSVLRGGEYGNRDLALAHGGTSEDFAWYIAAEYSESDSTSGRVIDSDLQSVFDQAFETEASLTPSRLHDQHAISNVFIKLKSGALSLDHFYIYGKGSARTGAANALDNERSVLRSVNHSTRLNYQLDTLSETIPGQLLLSGTYTFQKNTNRWDVFPPNSLFPVGDDGNLFTSGGGLVAFPDGVRGTPQSGVNKYDIRLTNTFTAGPAHNIRAELGYYWLQYTAAETKNFGPGVLDNIVYPADGSPYISSEMIDVSGTDDAYQDAKNDKSSNWLSIQDEWKPISTLSLALGLRHDRPSSYGSTTNPRLGLNWSLSDALNLRLFYGTAFREPKFGETLIRNNPSTRGNRSLKPETIATYEAGLRYHATNNLLFAANVYQYQTRGLIETQAIEGSSERQFQNGDGTDGQGIEVDVRWEAHDSLSLDFNLSRSSLKNPQGERLPGVPATLAYLGTRWKANPSISWNLGVKFVGDRARPAADLRDELKDYRLISSRVAWQISKKTSLSWIVHNASDSDAREYMPIETNIVNDIPLNGRQHLLELIVLID